MGAGIAQLACLGGYETPDPRPGPRGARGRRRDDGARGAGEGRQARAVERGGSRGGRAAGSERGRRARRPRGLRPRDRGGARGPRAEAGACSPTWPRPAGPETILATNTSSLPVTAIAAGTPDPERVVGMHFFNPPALMKLVEVVATADSSDGGAGGDHRGRRRAWAARRSAPRTAPASSPTASPAPSRWSRCGCSATGSPTRATIDRACRLGGGFRMGPFELIDLIGLDVNLSVARSFYAQGGEPERWRAEPDPGTRWSAKAGSGARAAAASTTTARARTASATPSSASQAPTLDPADAGEDRPGRGRDPPPPRRPDRQRGRLRPRRGGRLARGHGHRDAARLQLAARPARVHRADRPPSGPRALLEELRDRPRRRLPPRAAPPAGLAQPGPSRNGDLVDVAPAPVLARLDRADDRVARSRGMARSRACPRSCRSSRCGRSSWHMRRCTQLIPSSRHSSQPAISSGSSRRSTVSR